MQTDIYSSVCINKYTKCVYLCMYWKHIQSLSENLFMYFLFLCLVNSLQIQYMPKQFEMHLRGSLSIIPLYICLNLLKKDIFNMFLGHIQVMCFLLAHIYA